MDLERVFKCAELRLGFEVPATSEQGISMELSLILGWWFGARVQPVEHDVNACTI
jgi:hypothetical protein